MKRLVYVIASVFILFLSTHAAEYEYRLEMDGAAYRERWSVQAVESGYLIEYWSDYHGYRKTLADDLFRTRSVYSDHPRNGKMTIEAKDGQLFVEGIGKVGSFDAAKDRWLQNNVFLKEVIASKAAKTPFFVVGAQYDDKGKLIEGKIARMDLVWKRGKEETLTLGGTSHAAIRMTMTIDDFRGMFWKADYWFRLSDGLLLKYVSPTGGPGSPVATSVLVAER